MIGKFYKNILKGISFFAFIVAVYSANSASTYIAYQEKLPSEVKKLRKF